MIDDISQIVKLPDGRMAYVPFSDDHREAIRNLHENQLVRQKTTSIGAQKQRSVQQLRTFWKICTMIAGLAEERGHDSWDHKEKVAFQVKVGLQFVDASKTIVGPDGKIHLHYRSICFAELPHMKACSFFSRAYKFLDKTVRKMAEVTMAELFEQISLVYDPGER